MKTKHLFAFLIGIVIATPIHLFAHDGEEARVEFELNNEGSLQAGPVTLNFQLLDMKLREAITDQSLEVVHEKLIHMFIFDPALKAFYHVHPKFDGNQWSVSKDIDDKSDLNIKVSGSYWLWVQGTLKKTPTADGEEFSASTRLEIVGGEPANPVPPTLGEVRSGTDGISVASLSKEPFRAKHMVMATLTISRTDTSKPNLTPFLGANAHVIGVLSDGDTLIHVHPMDHMNHGGHGEHGGHHDPNPNALMLHFNFPEAGEYRLWVQFVDDGILRTIPLSVVVQP